VPHTALLLNNNAGRGVRHRTVHPMRSTWFSILLVVLAAVGRAEDDVTRVFVFAGQSNLEGADTRVADIDRFPPFVGLGEPQPDVLFSYVIGRESKRRSDGWVPLQPVGGIFGPELSFARSVKTRTGAPVAIIKVAAGGTTLGADWNPDEPSGFELYPLLIETVRSSLADLEERGVPHRLEGVVWHQGENDMFDDGFRMSYGENLANLLRRMRRDLGAPELHVQVGELCTKTIWGMDLRPRMAAIARGQRAATEADPLATYVPTAHIGVEIGGGVGLHYHYGTLGQLEHGLCHAEAYLARTGLGREPAPPLEPWPYEEGSAVDLYVLAGHRNMEGERAFTADLRTDDALLEPRRIPFRYDVGGGAKRSNGWEALRPAGLYSTFGPELSFAAELAGEPERNVAIAKFTHSGSQIIDWTPEGSVAPARDLFPRFIAFVEESVADLEARGHRVRLAGIVYHVGENDMSFGPYRRAAAERIGALVRASREALDRPDLRWIVSQQPPTDHERVNGIDVTTAIAALAEDDEGIVHLRAFDPPPQEEQLVLDAAAVVWLGRELARAATSVR